MIVGINTVTFLYQTCPSLVFPRIVRGVQDFLNHEHRVFNSEEFLRTREPTDQSFYKKVHELTFIHTNPLMACAACWSVLYSSQVLDTHIFHSFLRDRLNRKWDTFSRMEQNTRDHIRRYDVITERVKLTIQLPC